MTADSATRDTPGRRVELVELGLVIITRNKSFLGFVFNTLLTLLCSATPDLGIIKCPRTCELLDGVDEEESKSVPDWCNYLIYIAPHILAPVRHGVVRNHHLYSRLIHVVPALN